MLVFVIKIIVTLAVTGLCFAVAFQTAAYADWFDNMGMDALVPIGLIALASALCGGAITIYLLFFLRF